MLTISVPIPSKNHSKINTSFSISVIKTCHHSNKFCELSYSSANDYFIITLRLQVYHIACEMTIGYFEYFKIFYYFLWTNRPKHDILISQQDSHGIVIASTGLCPHNPSAAEFGKHRVLSPPEQNTAALVQQASRLGAQTQRLASPASC